MPDVNVAFLHYSAPPVVGGVEAVIQAHARVFLDASYPVKIIAGRGDEDALPPGVRLTVLPEVDSQHPRVQAISSVLETGRIPEDYHNLRDTLIRQLKPQLEEVDVLIVHNVFFKHFNLPLTAALFQILNELTAAGKTPRWWAWGHDFSWSSPNSRSKVFPGYPWNLLRTAHPGLRYAVVSEQRRQELVGLFGPDGPPIQVIYNGVDPQVWFGVSPEGWDLIQQMDLLAGDPVMVMPIRVTRAKNIEFAQQVTRIVKDSGRNPRLVITGPPDPHSENSIEYFRNLLELRSELDLEKEVRFVFETGLSERIVPQSVAAEILRAGDLMLMTSRREGFGMPVLEAGLIGLPVVCSANVPAAGEIGGELIFRFGPDASPQDVAELIQNKALVSPTACFRRKIRQHLTWECIFREDIEPWLMPQ